MLGEEKKNRAVRFQERGMSGEYMEKKYTWIFSQKPIRVPSCP